MDPTSFIKDVTVTSNVLIDSITVVSPTQMHFEVAKDKVFPLNIQLNLTTGVKSERGVALEAPFKLTYITDF